MIAFVFDLQIGIRHMSPVFPFISIDAGWATVSLPGRLWRAVAWILVFVVIVTGLTITPHQLGFFNHLAGGTKRAWHWFSDSNQDWGQGGPSISRYLPRYEDRSFRFNPIEGKTTGWVCMSTSRLVGTTLEAREKTRWLREDVEIKKFVKPCWAIFKIPDDYWGQKDETERTPMPNAGTSADEDVSTSSSEHLVDPEPSEQPQ